MKLSLALFFSAIAVTPLLAEVAAASDQRFVSAATPAKPSKPSPLLPEEERAGFTLSPGFEIELVAAEAEGVGKFVTVDFDQRERMWTMTAFEYPVDGNENPEAAQALYANPGKDKVLVFDTPFATAPAGGHKARVFAEGLAIPLGILPYKNGCYAQHGPDIVFLSDADNDGKADKREVILTGFGVQDSHLFPHQFTRAPGGWIWIAQGAFNYSKVRSPNEPPEKAVKFDMTRMAKFRPDGSEFTITSQGPCNIWGLVINGEGEAFIQEANDFGYPVMPFHEFANYPGCSDSQWKSYAPEFPGTAPDFRMGGTGLSGLALSDAKGAFPQAYADVMYVANPITRKIQAIKMHRDGPRWRLELLGDFIQSSDEWFRPVAIKFGPDGCLYIVDWYNKIISHNEVPRAHPDRDKTRGRIWRVKHKEQKPFAVPDFTKLSGDELLAKLGGDSLAQSHLAWQTIGERGDEDEKRELKLEAIIRDGKNSAARRIQALWSLQGINDDDIWIMRFPELARDENPRVRRALAYMDRNANHYTTVENTQELQPLVNDPDPEVRAAVIQAIGKRLGTLQSESEDSAMEGVQGLVRMAKPPLTEPTAPSTRNGKPIKVREAYDRDFERYLIRQTLERVPALVAKHLDAPEAATLPVEARLLAALALEPKGSAARVAKLLPQLTRPPGQEEVLRLAQFPEEPGVGDALKAVLANPATRTGVLEALLAVKTKLDSSKLTPLLKDAARELLAGNDLAGHELAIQLASGFQLRALEPELIALLERNGERGLPARLGEASSLAARNGSSPRKNTETGTKSGGRDAAGSGQDARAPQSHALAALRALREMNSGAAPLFAKLAKLTPDPVMRDEALHALAASKSESAAGLLLGLWPDLSAAQRRRSLDRLAATKSGAKSILSAIKSGTIAKSDLEGALVEKLHALLGDHDPDLAALVGEMGSLLRPVLALDGSDNAFTETGLSLNGAFTVETWVRLAPGIGNQDGILGAPEALDINFYDAKLRVWVGGAVHDAIIAKKSITPDLWTHVAVTRDERGLFKIYLDGALDQDQSKPASQKFENVRVGWTGTKGGTAGALSEFRIWNRARTATEIATSFDRSFPVEPRVPGLVFHATGAGPWGKLAAGAKVAKTTDFPPILSADEAIAVDAKSARLHALAQAPGDPARGQLLAAVCTACHLINGQGGNIGPNLSGAGAMGIDAIIRNLVTPNAAMEAGYRVYRVELKSGDLLEGFFVSEDDRAVVIRVPGAEDRRIEKRDVERATFLRRSLMPEGLLDGMQPQDVRDLFAYLKILR